MVKDKVLVSFHLRKIKKKEGEDEEVEVEGNIERKALCTKISEKL